MKLPSGILLWVSAGLSVVFAAALLSGLFRISELRHLDEVPPTTVMPSGRTLTPQEQQARIMEFRSGMVVHVNRWDFVLVTPFLLWGLVRLFDRPALSTKIGYVATGVGLVFLALLAVFFGALYSLYQ